jgi:hypothetical protein
MKPATSLLFNLNKVTDRTIETLLMDAKLYITDATVYTGRKWRCGNNEFTLLPNERISFTMKRSVRVRNKIWHKGETINLTVSDLLDTLDEVYLI